MPKIFIFRVGQGVHRAVITNTRMGFHVQLEISHQITVERLQTLFLGLGPVGIEISENGILVQ